MKTKISIAIIAFLAVFYTVFGFFGVPKLSVYYGTKILANMDLNLSVNKIKFNPFTYEANITGLSIQGDSPLIKFDEIYVDLDAINLFKKTIDIADLKLTNPTIFIQKDINGTYNFASLLSDESSTKSDDNSSLELYYDIKKLDIINASIAYIDLGNGFEAKLNDMSYSLENLSTKRNYLGSHKLLTSSNLVDKIITDANITLNPFTINGHAKITELKTTPFWVSFLKELPISLNSAIINSDLAYTLRLDESVTLDTNASLNIKNISVASGKNSFATKEFDVWNLKLNLLQSQNGLNLKLDNSNLNIYDFKAKFDGFDAGASEILLKDSNVTFDGKNLGIKIAKTNTNNLNASKLDTKITLNKAEINDANFTLLAKNLALLLSSINLADLKATNDKENFANLSNLSLNGLNLAPNSLKLDSINATNLDISSFVNDEGSKLANAFLALSSSKKTQAKSEPFDFEIKELNLNKTKVAIKDEISKNTVSNIDIKAKNIANNGEAKFDISINDELLKLSSNSSINMTTNKVESSINATLQSLHFITPYLKNYLNIEDINAKVDLKANINYQKDLSLNANVKTTNFSLKDANNVVVAAFASLNKTLNLNKNGIKISNISLTNPRLKVEISKDGELNLLKLIKDSKDNSKNESSKSPNIYIKNINIKNGSLEFSDKSLPIVFDTNITKISTTINDIKNKTRSDIAVNGIVAKHGFSEILLSIYPFEPTFSTDLILHFKNLNLKNATPYSAKFLGYEIADGRLNLNLNYKIKDGKLNGSNTINLDNLTLGKEIPSSDALSLPVKLGLAILKDSNNQIDIDLPISGDLNSPEFSYGSIVFKAIVQLFSDVVTSPFRFIGAALGISSEGVNNADFIPGTAFLSETSEENIKKLAQIAIKKPDIIFTITPTYATISDKYAISKRIIQKEATLLMNTKNLSYEDAIKQIYAQKINKIKFQNVDQAVDVLADDVKIKDDTLLKIAQKRALFLSDELQKNGVKKEQIDMINLQDISGSKTDKFIRLQVGIKTK
ncbi:putative DUF748 domains [Campylobacter iguaniorum]|uniref:DUF748 domain-containing protein n=1 Tax=Campylobacter iguaniorum TaxID=1244531 RepID=UPI0007C986AC|nr:DUF748 domain-containing protein [Campylobacter iguaniorum]ANE35357.1 putative DUF748 domains [Campylobacter iguaniorum]